MEEKLMSLTCSVGRCSKIRIKSDSIAILRLAASLLQGPNKALLEFEGISREDLNRIAELPRAALVLVRSNNSSEKGSPWHNVGSKFGARRVLDVVLFREFTVRIAQWLRHANRGACARCAIIAKSCD